MVGRVAVWRSPCVQPSDIEVWEAVQWPGDLKAVPTNCIICSVRGKGITALAGGDSDGDDVAVTLNQDLVEFVEHMEAAVAQLDWEQSCKPKKSWKWRRGSCSPPRQTGRRRTCSTCSTCRRQT